VGYGVLIHEVSRSHSDAPLSEGLLCTSDKLVSETSTWQHTTITTDIYASGGIRTRNPSKLAAADLRLRLRGHLDRQWDCVLTECILTDIDGVYPYW